MRKKIILLATLTSLACGVLAGGLSLAHRNFDLDLVKASEKEFVFDYNVGVAQFTNSSTESEVSVATGFSSNLETSVSLLEGNAERSKKYGGQEHFVHNGSTISSAKFIVEIGVNNPTSVSVTYGMIKSIATNVSEIRCYIGVYADDTRLDETATSGSSGINQDYTFSWSKKAEQTTPADKIRIEVNTVDGSNIYWGEPIYIKSIALNWTC